MNWFYLAGGVCGSILLILVALRLAIVLGGARVRPIDPLGLVRRPIEEARVERLANNDLRVTWDDPAAQVSVSAGADPAAIDWHNPLVVVRGAREALLAGLDPARRFYLGLQFEDAPGSTPRRLVVAERHLPLAGARNFRDLGGYCTADGRRVRWGRIFRSDQLAYLTDADLEYLAPIGLQAVCDLRATNERAELPDRLPSGAAALGMAVYEDLARAPLMNILLFRRHKLGETLGLGYRLFLEQGAPSYGRLLGLAAKGQPLVYHCSAGKDRAGIGTALLLGALGVPDETILADYSLSNLAFDHLYDSFVREDRLRRLGVPNHQVKVLFTVDPAWLEGLLAYLREQYGTLENYLIQKAGLDMQTIQQLRAQLLT
jgi:protein-tyrosine phosphatase